jgi:hypothetical protein
MKATSAIFLMEVETIDRVLAQDGKFVNFTVGKVKIDCRHRQLYSRHRRPAATIGKFCF